MKVGQVGVATERGQQHCNLQIGLEQSERATGGRN
jgi:hypothetical protein